MSINRTLISSLVAGAAAVLALPTNIAHAQESGSVTSSETMAASPALEEVVVTARRKSEKLQSVPLAITSFTQQALENERIQSVQDLQYFVPSLHVTGSGLQIRGQGSANAGSGTFGSVIVYLNEVPFSQNEFGPGSYYDLADLEVLKGPQGTLFGRNTTGGAILLTTQRPTNKFEGYGAFTIGDYNDHEFEGAINVPIIDDKLLVRVAGNLARRDGYTKLASTGLDLDNRNYDAFRVSAIVRPTDDIENTIIYDYYHSRTNGLSYILVGVNPKGTAAQFFPSLAANLSLQQQLGTQTQIGSNVTPFLSNIRWGITDNFQWNIADNLILKNIAAYRLASFSGNSDEDTTNLPIFNNPPFFYSNVNAPQNAQYTEEIQLQGKSLGERLDWVAGGFLLFAHDGGQEPAISSGLLFGRPRVSTALPVERSQAVFLQASYDLSDILQGLKFTAGYRETWDRRSNTLTSFNAGACVYVGVASCVVSAGHNFAGDSWTIGAEYQIASDTMGYVRSSRGYKSGGLNPQAILPSFISFGPEYVTDVEIGLKADWQIGNVKGRLNGALYHQDYQAIQISTTIVQNTIPGQVVVNGGTASVDGGELQLTVVPVARTEFSVNYAYGHGQYDKFTAPGISFSNTHYQGLPLNQFTIDGKYTLPLPEEWGAITADATYIWRSHEVISAVAEAFVTEPSYSLFNARLDWTGVMGSNFDVALFGTNLTDTAARDFDFSVYNAIGFSSARYIEPRMWGAQIKYHFGN